MIGHGWGLESRRAPTTTTRATLRDDDDDDDDETTTTTTTTRATIDDGCALDVIRRQACVVAQRTHRAERASSAWIDLFGFGLNLNFLGCR